MTLIEWIDAFVAEQALHDPTSVPMRDGVQIVLSGLEPQKFLASPERTSVDLGIKLVAAVALFDALLGEDNDERLALFVKDVRSYRQGFRTMMTLARVGGSDVLEILKREMPGVLREMRSRKK